ncbi:MAG: hypothetical protein HFG80_10625 [Eubacterium sp.]|nr:hypothetical protein [Eubacterium sp.]
MKEYNDQLMKFKITNDKLKMEIKLSDLAWFFRNSPDNVAPDVEHEFCRVRRGKNREFAEKVVKLLMDESPENENDVRWGHMLESAFEEIRESGANFLKYYDD